MKPEPEMRDLKLDWHGKWQLVWRRDDPYVLDGDAYLDKLTGQIRWGPSEEEDPWGEEATTLKAELGSEPDRYVQIPRLTHGDHHEIFAVFVETLPSEVRRLCNTRSIGGFRRDLDRHFPENALELWHSWLDHHDEALKERARRWLEQQGIRPEWH